MRLLPHYMFICIVKQFRSVCDKHWIDGEKMVSKDRDVSILMRDKHYQIADVIGLVHT